MQFSKSNERQAWVAFQLRWGREIEQIVKNKSLKLLLKIAQIKPLAVENSCRLLPCNYHCSHLMALSSNPCLTLRMKRRALRP